ncbi:hypothetical protein ENBRE01_1679 [Enteropsectra breve]|nr:hypothetical protein ENBRE01_1679 [Enteropsectra breve]
MMLGKTLCFRGDDVHGVKTSKERLTELLCASMLGEKRPALIIGKHLKPRWFKNKSLERIKYYANKSA